MKLEWALHIIPCVAMLYLMRKAGEPTASNSAATTPTLNGARGLNRAGGDERTGLAGGGADETGRGLGIGGKNGGRGDGEGPDIDRHHGSYGSGGGGGGGRVSSG